MRLRDMSYGTDFYYKGVRYRQLIRPRNPECKNFRVICTHAKDGNSQWYSIRASREVKPVYTYLKGIDDDR